MSVMTHTPTRVAAQVQSGAAAAALQDRLSRRQTNELGPLVIFIVAAAILLAIAMSLATAIAIYCMRKGGSVEWWTRNGWKVWEIKIACRMRG